MIKAVLTNDILKRISNIDEKRIRLESVHIPAIAHNRLRKNSKKRSAFSSNKIEGNPLSEQEASAVIDEDPHRHFLNPEQEIRNYYMALELLEEKKREKAPFSRELVMEVQALVEKGASREKRGLRGATPPGVLFAVYDSATGAPEYIPPEYVDIPGLLDELVEYVNYSDDHPLIKAAIVHYQLVTIHPFEDGNGRTARLMSGYILDVSGYGFAGVGSLEEYFAYDPEEYYDSLQMGLPALYYLGRDNPPHPEIWIDYFLRMVELYSAKAYETSVSLTEESVRGSLSHLNEGEKGLLRLLLKGGYGEFTPIEISRQIGVTNRTVINRLARLAQNGFVVPNMAGERIRSYFISDFSRENKKDILAILK